MKFVHLILTLSILGASGATLASEDLAKAKNCLSCHSVANKMLGPAFKDVAAKYKADKKAAPALAAKIKTGGKGVWGEIPMPPNNVTEAESRQLVAWILGLK